MSAVRTDLVAPTCAVAEAHAREHDEAATFPVEALATMRRTGLLGLMVPVDQGGGGGTLSELVDATIELGRADLSVALIFAMHSQQVATLARHGSDRLRTHVLPAVADGAIYLASVTTEPGKGGDLLISDSATEHVRGTLRIDREAPIVTGGRHADAFLVTVRTPGATSPAQVDLVYAARDQLRLDVLGEWHPLGMRATESVPMRLAGAVPDWQVVGEGGDFRAIATTFFGPVAHIGWAAAWLGTAAGACSRVVRHLRSPSGRSRSDPTSELLLTRLAATRARLDVVNALLRHTVRVVSAQEDVATPPGKLLINTLKTEAADRCFEAVHELVELTGLGDGYLAGSPLRLERAFRDLRSASLNYGNDRLRLANGSLALMDSGVRFA
jgi:acyl-CoA dehydrogenase